MYTYTERRNSRASRLKARRRRKIFEISSLCVLVVFATVFSIRLMCAPLFASELSTEKPVVVAEKHTLSTAGAAIQIEGLTIVETIELTSKTQAENIETFIEQADGTQMLTADKPIETQKLTYAKSPRYAGLALTEKEKLMLAQMVHLEGRGEPREGQLALVEVTLNRMLAPGFDGTIEEIIYADGQYATAKMIAGTEPDPQCIEAVEAVLRGEHVLPEKLDDGRLVVFFAKQPENSHIAMTIGTHVFCYAYN